ncbi:MAG: hybrid sensor histidine kinase/response regulator [endosymbiont of Galathealinum brachiosum]|uniref:Chemotaxis protein CheA n=1 Tax=endosymbiont of Galathealinum brachiosum TaxID=2200906 RepID=A0A370DAM2_9GAMM|nr:MAG: hybrid sensor histidine kinase/response regulator [endosymbiont of Galathealinum brachiosum]
MTDKSNINESMLDLFKAEIDTQSEKLYSFINQIESTDDLSATYESLINSTRAIKGAAKLVHVDIIMPVIELQESVFSHYQSIDIKADKLSSDIFKSTIDLFIQIASLPANKLSTPESKTETSINSCLDQLNILLSTKNTDKAADDKNNENQKAVEDTQFYSTAENIDPEMFQLFCTELQNSVDTINSNLLEIDNKNQDNGLLEAMMRAAHSIKGAARMIGIEGVVKLAHSMEDVFVAAQNRKIELQTDSIDQIFSCNDLLIQIEFLDETEVAQWTQDNTHYINQFIQLLTQIHNGQTIIPVKLEQDSLTPTNDDISSGASTQTNDNMVRVSTSRINKLVGLAGELTVSSNWIRQYSDSMLVLKRKHNDILDQIDRLRSVIEDNNHSEHEHKLITGIQHKAEDYRDEITSRLMSLDNFDRRSSSINSQINHEIIASRMRPFSDSTQGFKRMVRDISGSLNKIVQLHIEGEDTPVDRDILEKLDAPLNHMIRNAIDHGIETPDERLLKGKPESGTITVSASHQSGRLRIQVKDDGKGVDIEDLRDKILDKKLVNANMAENLSKTELLDFLFLPSFSTRSEVTELSGRGVGLDIVHSALQEVRGKLHADTEIDQGMEINMELPLTLSVIRSLMVSISEELYAFPLAKIQSLVTIKKQDISIFEDKQYISIDNKHIGLIHCAQILGINHSSLEGDDIPVIIIGDWNMSYGLVVDKLIGERGLALRTLNKKLGKIKDISSAAITDDGEPVLVFDIDDLKQSIHDIISGKDLYKVGSSNTLDTSQQKRVLVVDDSLTVREIEKKLLESRGYLVDIAIDGVDGWNTVRNADYDLVISDIDMPRMNGIEFITMIKNDAALRSIPVMMVSYKDRPEDKQKGLEAGADYYLTKGSFHDDTLLDAVIDLIGEAKG